MVVASGRGCSRGQEQGGRGRSRGRCEEQGGGEGWGVVWTEVRGSPRPGGGGGAEGGRGVEGRGRRLEGRDAGAAAGKRGHQRGRQWPGAGNESPALGQLQIGLLRVCKRHLNRAPPRAFPPSVEQGPPLVPPDPIPPPQRPASASQGGAGRAGPVSRAHMGRSQRPGLCRGAVGSLRTPERPRAFLGTGTGGDAACGPGQGESVLRPIEKTGERQLGPPGARGASVPEGGGGGGRGGG
jgi:hypothetical protein